MGKATGGLVQQGFCNSGAKRHQFTFCASIKICILVESFGFDLPAIAKPRNVTCNAIKKNRINEENINYYDNFFNYFQL